MVDSADAGGRAAVALAPLGEMAAETCQYCEKLSVLDFGC